MSGCFWFRDEATGRKMTVTIPRELRGRPAQEIFDWLAAEAARRAEPFPVPTVPGAAKESTPCTR